MAEFFSLPSFLRRRQNISRKGFCLCTLVSNLWAQMYFKKNKQIYPNEVSKELNRTAWILDECLGPICFTFRSLGSGSTELIPVAPHVSLLGFPLDLAWEGWKMWESLVSWLRFHPGLNILITKATWAKRRWAKGVVLGAQEGLDLRLSNPLTVCFGKLFSASVSSFVKWG